MLLILKKLHHLKTLKTSTIYKFKTIIQVAQIKFQFKECKILKKDLNKLITIRKIKNGEVKENNLKKLCKHPKRFKNWSKIKLFHKMSKKDKLKS